LNDPKKEGVGNLLQGLDYSVLQQCMHCGLCLPSCPTYVETLRERSSPRGRIAMMRAIADGDLETSRIFAEEMYFCLGCLACETACPAGVDYATLFEQSRAQVEASGVLDSRGRRLVRALALRWIFTSRRRISLLAKALYLFQKSGLRSFVRASGLLRLLPASLRELEPLTPEIQRASTRTLYQQRYRFLNPGSPKYRVALLSGCVQDIAFSNVNADTIAVLQLNGCEVILPEAQQCCGSLHAHNGDLASARDLARVNIDAFLPKRARGEEAEAVDAIIVNAGGCGSHMRHYDRLLADDVDYAERAAMWSRKVRDICEFLVEIDFRPPAASPDSDVLKVAYHESCHLKHGQGVSDQPRRVLESIPGVELAQLPEADWCCGSAGIYNITQPEMSMKLLDRKMGHIASIRPDVVATGNPGCVIQIEHGIRKHGLDARVQHPVSLLAAAYERRRVEVAKRDLSPESLIVEGGRPI